MKQTSLNLLLVCGVLASLPLSAQNESFRTGKPEFIGGVTMWTAPTITARDFTIPNLGTNDVTASFDDTALLSLGGGYSFSEHWNIWGDLQFGETDFNARWGNQLLTGSADLFSGRINVDYNLLAKSFTPFVTAGVGFTYIDSNVPSGDPEYWCWWDYWWGLVCDGRQPTHNQWSFAPNAGIGVRWDAAEGFFIKAMGNWTWSELGENGYEVFPQATLHFGWSW